MNVVFKFTLSCSKAGRGNAVETCRSTTGLSRSLIACWIDGSIGQKIESKILCGIIQQTGELNSTILPDELRNATTGEQREAIWFCQQGIFRALARPWRKRPAGVPPSQNRSRSRRAPGFS